MFKFDFLEKGLGIVSPSHFMNDFSRKIFMLYSRNWPDFIVWLPLFLETFGNMCIEILCFSAYDVINFEANLLFLIKLFFYKTKKLRQYLKYLKNWKRF